MRNSVSCLRRLRWLNREAVVPAASKHSWYVRAISHRKDSRPPWRIQLEPENKPQSLRRRVERKTVMVKKGRRGRLKATAPQSSSLNQIMRMSADGLLTSLPVEIYQLGMRTLPTNFQRAMYLSIQFSPRLLLHTRLHWKEGRLLAELTERRRTKAKHDTDF